MCPQWGKKKAQKIWQLENTDSAWALLSCKMFSINSYL